MPDEKNSKAMELEELLHRIQVSGSFESVELADRIYELGSEILRPKMQEGGTDREKSRTEAAGAA